MDSYPHCPSTPRRAWQELVKDLEQEEDHTPVHCGQQVLERLQVVQAVVAGGAALLRLLQELRTLPMAQDRMGA